MAQNDTSPRPWTKLREEGPSGVSIKIVDANGGVVCLMKNGGGRKEANADLLVRAVASVAGA